jgi:hypothetical protein
VQGAGWDAIGNTAQGEVGWIAVRLGDGEWIWIERRHGQRRASLQPSLCDYCPIAVYGWTVNAPLPLQRALAAVALAHAGPGGVIYPPPPIFAPIACTPALPRILPQLVENAATQPHPHHRDNCSSRTDDGCSLRHLHLHLHLLLLLCAAP